jgi:hypothetical protein
MLQANPSLRPNAVKAILKASADANAEESAMAQGAGFLNARAAVELAGTFGEAPEPELLDDLIGAYEPQEGAWSVACEASDTDCLNLTADCTATAACFGDLAGAVVGVDAPATETVVWGIRTARPTRRRSRAAGMRINRNPGVS